MEGNDANRRGSPRVNAGGLEAIYLFDNRINNAQVLDLSIGGAKLRSATAPPVGAQTEVTFSTGKHRVIRASARVVQRNRRDQSLRLCFVAMKGANRHRLRQLVDEFHADQISTEN